MGRRLITEASLREHVTRLQDDHPPIRLDSVDRTINDPRAVARRFAPTIDYLARVELEVERNVLELLTIMPEASEVDRFFYADVWSAQELAHGAVLDRLQTDLGLPAAQPVVGLSFTMKVMGALAHIPAIQEISRLLYYLTGAATERQAVVAYSTFIKQLDEMGERAISETIVHPIKVQEPGHYAFYMMSATQMVQDEVLAPWQLHLARLMRSASMNLVGTNGMARYKRQMGELVTELGFEHDLEGYARQIGRLEAKLLWANRHGMEFPPYFLKALRESVDMYREQGSFARPA